MEVMTQEGITMTQEPQSSYHYKTPSYTLKAVKAYQEKNREKLNEYAKNRWREKYDVEIGWYST